MFNQGNSTQFIGNYRLNKQKISLDDLSITSQIDDESDEDLCKGEIFQFKLPNAILEEDLYPDYFPQFPKDLVQLLIKFTKTFRKHTVAKILYFELNMALIFCQISYKLGKIDKYYHDQQQLQNSFKLFQYYLKLQSITNLCRLIDMIKILIGKKETNFKWQQIYKEAFLDLKDKCKVFINENDGMKLLIAIDSFILLIVNCCNKFKLDNNYVSYLQKINKDLFDNQLAPLQIRIKLIPQHKDITLAQIQPHFQNQQVQKQFQSFTKVYLNKFYRKIHQFYLTNQLDRDINELLFLLILAKLSSDILPFKLISFISKEKNRIMTTSRILKADDFTDYIIQSNIYFRAQLPKIHLSLKSRGFMKLLSFLKQSQFVDIQKEIVWCYNAKANLSSNL